MIPLPTRHHGPVLELSRWLDAPVARVFQAFTEPDLLRQWWGPKGFVIEEISFPAAVGQRYRVSLRGPEGEHYEHVGVFTEVVPAERLSYTWQWVAGPLQRQEMLVELCFATEDGGTRIDLRKSGFEDQSSRTAHAGWPKVFARLADWLANNPAAAELAEP